MIGNAICACRKCILISDFSSIKNQQKQLKQHCCTSLSHCRGYNIIKSSSGYWACKRFPLYNSMIAPKQMTSVKLLHSCTLSLSRSLFLSLLSQLG